MDTMFVQNLRSKLYNRVRRLKTADHRSFHALLKQFWEFLGKHEVFRGIIREVEYLMPNREITAINIVNESIDDFYPKTEREAVAISYYVLKGCVESPDPDVEGKIGYMYNRSGDIDDGVDKFRSLFLDPLYEYLDEKLGDQKINLGLLIKYKHKCEWFRREELFELWSKDTRKGESNLKRHLFEYLHDQGLEFQIEPSSASGEVDFIADQAGDERMIAEVKVFSSPKSKSQIVSGFSQAYRYVQDYNEQFGYLLVFNTSDVDLKFNLSDQNQWFPSLDYNGKTIFILTIDIYSHEKSASQRGGLKPVEIAEEDLIKTVEGSEEQQGS